MYMSKLTLALFEKWTCKVGFLLYSLLSFLLLGFLIGMVTTVKLQGEIANAGGMAVLHKEKSFFLTCRNTVCKITSAGRNFYHKNKMTILTSNRASYIVGWIGG